MKAGHLVMSIATPVDVVNRLDRLRGYNRTKHVNAAIATYLDVQGPPVNRYGVDCDYFRKQMATLQRDIGNYTPKELARTFANMASTASHQGINPA